MGDFITVRWIRENGKIYRWTFNENYYYGFWFLVGFSIPVIYTILKIYFIKKQQKKDQEKNLEIPNPRGGTSVEKCIDPDLAYEITDATLKTFILRILKENQQTNLPLIISSEVFIFAAIVSKTLLQTLITTTIASFTSGGLALLPKVQTSVVIMAGVAGMSVGMTMFIIGTLISKIIPYSNIVIPMGVFLIGAILKTQLSLGNVNCDRL
jgi:hypothetical protein